MECAVFCCRRIWLDKDPSSLSSVWGTIRLYVCPFLFVHSWYTHDIVNFENDSNRLQEKTKLVKSYFNKHGEKKFDGNKKELRESQEYPQAFGDAVIRIGLENKSDRDDQALGAILMALDMPTLH